MMPEMTLVLDYLILPHIWPYHWLLTVRLAALFSTWLLPARWFLLTHLDNDEGLGQVTWWHQNSFEKVSA